MSVNEQEELLKLVTEIVPGVYLGNKENASNEEFYIKNNIKDFHHLVH